MACPPDTFEQTLFLGCSVESFRCSLGWNEQPSTVAINVTRDTCEGPRVYYNLLRQTATMEDPGMRIYGADEDALPEIGAPVYFRLEDFEFCGLIQSIQQIDPASDTERYEVTLVSPTQLLQGVNLILGDYIGVTRGFNIFNIYGYEEYVNGSPASYYQQYGVDGPLFGSVGGGFGGANLTEAGMPWTKVRNAIQVLTSSMDPFVTLGIGDATQFSEYNRICYVGAAVAGYGLLPHDTQNVTAGGLFGYAEYISEYYLDISDIPVSDTDYRIPGPSADLLTVISQVCQDLAHDYYVELIPVVHEGNVLKVIKFRTVSRVAQPPSNIVSQYIDALNSIGVERSSYGLELRNEATTNFVIGGQKRTMYQVYNGVPIDGTDPDDAYFDTYWDGNTYVRDTIVPFYGLDYWGNPYVVSNSGTIDVPLTGIAQSLPYLGEILPSSLTVSTESLKFAANSFDSWMTSVKWESGTQLWDVLHTNSYYFRSTWDRLAMMPTGVMQDTNVRDFQNTNLNFQNTAAPGEAQLDTLLAGEMNKLYRVFQQMGERAKDHLMVRIPYTVAKYTNGRLETTDTPTDGGWTEHTNVLGLANPGGLVDYFRNDDGTIHPIACFPYASGVNLDSLGDSKYYYSDPTGSGILYTEVNTLESIVFLDRFNVISPRVIVQIPDLADTFVGQEQAIDAQAASAGIQNRFGRRLNQDEERATNKYVSRPNTIEPSGIALAFQSNVNTYGPWKPDNAIEAGPPGRINIIKDDTIVPWTYGSYNNMSTVAQAKANDSVGGMNAGENGSVTLPGLPTIPLGSELASLGELGSAYYTSNSQLYENRTANFDTLSYTPARPDISDFTVDTPIINYGIWDNSFGPNVTSINLEIGIDGIKSTYSFRTYTTRFGSLSKNNADLIGTRLSQMNKLMAQQRLYNATKANNSANTQRLLAATDAKKKSAGKASMKAVNNTVNSIDDDAAAESPNSVMVGSVKQWRVDSGSAGPTQAVGNFKRSLVVGKSLPSLVQDTDSSGFNTKAIMSWDGILRPVSLSGSGGLPRLIRPINYVNFETGDGASNTDFDNRYFNPLANPSGRAYSELSFLHTGSPLVGHDIDIVARLTHADFQITGSGGQPFSRSLVMASCISGNKIFTDYQDDYRFKALRGPIMIQGWGYDTNNKPVPNAADILSSMESGIYENENLTNLFYPNWLKRPETWPVAPLDVRLNRERGVWEAGSGSGGNSTKQFVLIVEDLAGYSTNDLISVPINVRVLTRTWNSEDAQFEVDDEEEFIEVVPVETTTLLMSDEGCCGETSTVGGSIFPGLYLDSPVAVNNFISSSEMGSSITVSGGGVNPTSFVELAIVGVGNFDSDTHFTINSDGTFSVAISFVAHDGTDLPVKIGGQETLLGEMTGLAPRYIVVYVGDTYTGPDLTWFANQPNRPSLASGSDTGRSGTDNWTADNNPAITLSSTNQGLGTGHGYAIYVDGELWEEDYFVSAPSTLGYSNTYTFTGLDLADGIHTIQWQELYQDGKVAGGDVYGPISDPLWLLIDSEETGEVSEDVFGSSDITYGRYGQIETISGTKFLTAIDGCNVPLTQFLSDRVAGFITAIGTASADFDAEDTSVTITGGSVVITNPTDDADPTAPTSISLVGTEYTGIIGDKLKMRYNSGIWELRGVTNV